MAVIGAGWAGLAAAVQATADAHGVTLFDLAGHVGGRARSVTIDSLALDNGQHILIGAYTETLRLMRTELAVNDMKPLRPLLKRRFTCTSSVCDFVAPSGRFE